PVAVSAGPIFIPGKLDGDTFTPGADAASPCYSIRYSSIKAEISGGIAKVRLLETVSGPAAPVETACIIPLPEAVAGDDAAVAVLDADGKETPVAGSRLLSVAAAQALYESVAKGIGRTQLLALSGRPTLAVPAFMLHGEMQFVVTFRQKVENSDGIQSIHLPSPVLHCASGVVGRLTAEVALAAEKPLRTIFSPSHDITVVRDGLTKAMVQTKCDQWAGNADLRLFWVADADELGLRVLASRPEKGEDGYFMLLGNPTGSEVAAKPVARDVIFVLDTSGSMRGEKIEQARAAMEYCLGRLNPGDRFNIITFGSKVSPFREVPIDVSAENVAAARTFVEDIVSEGGTNISGALAAALAGEAKHERPRLAIFLTDGAPTDGELIPDKIIERVKKENAAKTQIFVFGVGNDVNAHLLDRLAEVTDGSSEYVKPREEIDAKVAVLYDRLANPVLADIKLAYGELQTRAVYPKKLPALFRGSEIMVFGRYRDGGQHTFTVSGQLAGKALSYSCTAKLPETSAPEAGTEFVAPIWA
ncbi:MAG: VWA domain-containing protein, partial [bacterium]